MENRESYKEPLQTMGKKVDNRNITKQLVVLRV